MNAQELILSRILPIAVAIMLSLPVLKPAVVSAPVPSLIEAICNAIIEQKKSEK